MFTDSGITEDQAAEFSNAIIRNDPNIAGPAGLKEIYLIYGEEMFRRDVVGGAFRIHGISNQIAFVTALKEYTGDGDYYNHGSSHNDQDAEQGIFSGPLKKKDESFIAFLSHNWGKDKEKRDNHKRVVQFKKALGECGIKNLWIDDERMTGNIVHQMCDGIDNSKLVIVFVTRAYIDKVAGRGPNGFSDNCLLEFQYAARKKGSPKMIAVLMEGDCSDASQWDGPVGMHLGGTLYYSFKNDSDLKRCAEEVATEIRSRLGELQQG